MAWAWPLQAREISAAPAGVLEVGGPQFAIRGPETLGLATPPTDLHVLPDGRILIFAAQQLAIGDGVRWEVFRQSANDTPVPATGVAVDQDGSIYVGVDDGFGRIELGETTDWRVRKVADWPDGTRRGIRSAPRMCVEADGEWFWHSGSGALLSWRPGQSARVLGRADTIQAVFRLKGAVYLSDRANGALWRLAHGTTEPVSFTENHSTNATITCAVPFDHDRMLVGTYGHGLRFFDGRVTRAFPGGGILAENVRVNDLCVTQGGFYAAAIENYGIYFFDRHGAIVQVLDRRFDHRLSHVQKLVAAPGGVIWALLSDSVLGVEFPSRVSHFEPLIGTGATTTHPIRFDGQLWIVADGFARRAKYDGSGRLTELAVDTPPGRFASNPSTAMRTLVTATDHGAYYRSASGWMAFAPDTDDLWIVDHPPVEGRWLYAATHELGWLRLTATGIEVERISEPRLSKVYGSVRDRDGSVWLELGAGRIGHLQLVGGAPKVTIYGAEAGLPEGWAQIFRIDERVRFNMSDHILRFDEGTQHFAPDEEFARRFPDLPVVIGRPGRDSSGRVWVTTTTGVRILEETDHTFRDVHERLPAGLRPYAFTFESSGVVWMHSERHLARYDPAMPLATDAPFRALITRVTTSGTQRNWFDPGATMPPLPFADNSLIVRFCAPGRAFQPVSFDVRLEGVGRSEWMPSGSSGSAVFNRLEEGHYILHVRPRSESLTGQEATFQFQVLPPWFRTRSTYVAYVFGAVGILLLSGRLFSYLQRRETARLERVVADRTRELNASNDRLATQVEEIRVLSHAIEQSPVGMLLADAGGTIVFANARACELSGRGAAELIGRKARALQSGSPTPESLDPCFGALRAGRSWRGQRMEQRADGRRVHLRTMVTPIRNPEGRVRQFLVLEEDITDSISENEQRRRLEAQLFQSQKLESLGTLAGGIAHDFNNLLTAMLGYCELAELNAKENGNISGDLAGIRMAGLRARDLVARILAFSRQQNTELAPIDLSAAVSEALNLIRASMPTTIELVRKVDPGMVRADTTQIQQIVLNLCTNAIQALPDQRGRIEVTVEQVQVTPDLMADVPRLWLGSAVRLVVADNGCGMAQSTLDRIFDPFFTTKPQGEGTGLGLSIVQSIVNAHEGAIRVRSTPGAGTTFELFFHPTDISAAATILETPVPHGHDEEILVIDDERSVADFVAARLRQLGYRPTVYYEPEAALEAFAEQPEHFHAIVTDLTMPRLTGADLVQRIRARGWLIPAVIVTGYSGERVRSTLKSIPRCLVLAKPFTGDELGRALHQVISDYSIPRN